VTGRALLAVQSQAVAWDPGLGVAGGFRWASGRRIDDYPLLVELWSAKLRGLVQVDGGAVLPSKRGGA
jgi:hypothetical protein